MNYLDFELEIGPGSGRDYPVFVVRSPAGEAREVMRFPFDELALANRLLTLQNALLRSGGKRRLALSPEQQSVQSFGRELFNALLPGEVRTCYDVSQERARADDKGLRLKLRIQAPELAALPWEFLYDPRQAEYVSLSVNTPVVRYLELPQPILPLTVTPPLHILGMIAGPRDLPPLDADRERQRVEVAIEPLRASGLLELTWLESQTWRDLNRAMRHGPWHIFHFIGHGGFDRQADEGLIALADEAGDSYRLSATQLGRLLADYRTLRLVLLNICEGARGSELDIFSSTAAILVRRGIPAVLAMQYEITDRAAIEFGRAFYEAVADGLPVDAAVAEARKAINLAVNNSIEWGTPVLYMRSPDGVLFNIQGQVERLAQKRAAAERLAREKAEQERLAQERAEQERLAREKAEAERLAAQKAEAERIAQEKAEQERLAQKKAEQERLAKEKREAKRAEAKRLSALLLTTMGRAIGWAVGGFLLSRPVFLALGIGSTAIYLGAGGAVVGGLGGAITGLALRRAQLPYKWGHVLVVILGWTIGWVIAGIMTFTIGIPSGVIAGAIAGTAAASGVLFWNRSRARPPIEARPESKSEELRAPVWTSCLRLAVLFLLLLGFFGPWVRGCTPATVEGQPSPPPEVYSGWWVLYIIFLGGQSPLSTSTVENVVTGLVPITLLVLWIVTLLRLGWRRRSQNRITIWIERVASGVALFELAWISVNSQVEFLWGFWSTFAGVLLAPLNLIGELITTRLRLRSTQ